MFKCNKPIKIRFHSNSYFRIKDPIARNLISIQLCYSSILHIPLDNFLLKTTLFSFHLYQIMVSEWMNKILHHFHFCIHRDFCKMAFSVALWTNPLACQHGLSTAVRRNQDPISTWTPSFRYKDCHYEYQMVARLSYPSNGKFYTLDSSHLMPIMSQVSMHDLSDSFVLPCEGHNLHLKRMCSDVFRHFNVLCCLTTCWVIIDVLTFQGSLFQGSQGNKPQ